MWQWLWGGQFTRGEELLLILVALFIEDWIDQWRLHRRTK